MKPTLVILAAGMASRYGGNKQIDGFGPNGETILEYSIFDAIRAGFGKVCFIIRREHQSVFEGKFAKLINDEIEVEYAYQELQLAEYGFSDHIERAKPWGTGHALLAARNLVKENFCVINADDFYSLTAYEKMASFLSSEAKNDHFALLGYKIGKTLSDSGPVTRGVCAVSDSGVLKWLDERSKVYRNKEKTIEFLQADGSLGYLKEDNLVSMNFWGFTPEIFSLLEPLFVSFVNNNKTDPKAEFLIPEAAQTILQSGKASFKVIPIDAPCFGVTYQEDKPLVKRELSKLVEKEIYPKQLWKGIAV